MAIRLFMAVRILCSAILERFMNRRLAAFVKRVARVARVDVHRYRQPIVSSAMQLFAPKFSTDDIAREIDRITTSPASVCVLTDGYVASPPCAGLVDDGLTCRRGYPA